MNVTKASVTGIDIPIQKLQTSLYGQIKTLWAVSDQTFNMYGRAYRNQTNDSGYTPEIFKGNNEYSDAYFDDKLAGSAFFGLGEVEQVKNGDTTADVFIIFMVNLPKIKPGATRNDEEARVDIERFCMTANYGFVLNGIVIGIDNVFKEYSGYKKTKGITFRDMHPWHCFRLNFKVTYNIYDC